MKPRKPMEHTSSITYTNILPHQDVHPTHCIREFQSEFFSIMHGASLAYGYIAAEIAADTAIWGYKEIRKRQCYWIDKKQLLTRIIRTTNISLWQKHKEKLYAKGLLVDGVCCIIGEKTAWVGCFGEASVLEIRGNKEQRLMGVVAGERYDAQQKLGSDRYKLSFVSASFPFESGDTFILASGTTATMTREELVGFQERQEQGTALKSTTGSILVIRSV